MDTVMELAFTEPVFTCADSRVGDDGGIGPLVGAGDGI